MNNIDQLIYDYFIYQARDWLRELVQTVHDPHGLGPHEVDALSDDELKREIGRRYRDGWDAFVVKTLR